MNKKIKAQSKRIEEIYSEKIHIGVSSIKYIPASHAADIKQKAANEGVLNTLKNQIEEEWENKSIPGSLREVYRHFIFSLHARKAIIFITKEIFELKSYNSLVQASLKGIYAREESLQSIKEMNEYLSGSNEWTDIIDIKLECAEILHAHRMLTLNVAESIERWRDSFIFEVNDFKPVFIYNGENYIEKINNDLDFLRFSELSKVFKFSSERDPFLIFPSKIVEKKRGKIGSSNYFMHNGQVIIPLPSIIVKRVQRMEHFIKTDEKPAPKSAQRSMRDTPLRTPQPAARSVSRDNQLKELDNISKSILERIYREEIVFEVNAIISSQVNEIISRNILLSLDEILDPILAEISASSIAEAIKIRYEKATE